MTSQIEKSSLRSSLESGVRLALSETNKFARSILRNYNGSFAHPQDDTLFLQEMSIKLAPIWQLYWKLHQDLLLLDDSEGLLSIQMALPVLKHIFERLPTQATHRGYYPGSGLDMFPALLCEEVTLQDIGFDIKSNQPDPVQLWWHREMYSPTKRLNVLNRWSIIIDEDLEQSVHFLGGDMENPTTFRHFNHPDCTLFLAGYHSVLDYLERVEANDIDFGAIVLADPAEGAERITPFLEKKGYQNATQHSPIQGSGWMIPYTLEMYEVHVYTKSKLSVKNNQHLTVS